MDKSELEKAYLDKIDIIASHHEEDKPVVYAAFEFALKAHGDQKRKSGEPYIIHPVSVASIIDEWGFDTESVLAGLLHDTIEDTAITYQDVEKRFGTSVAELVDGVTKLGHVIYQSREEEQMEDLRKMFIAMAKDIRVIIIKLADCTHNIRTIQFMAPEKQRKKALEIMEIYAPLAHRLGMQSVKWELEDRSLKVLDPVGYGEIENYLKSRSKLFSNFLENTKKSIEEKLKSQGIEGHVKARLKQIYSIYRKLYGQNLGFSEIYDICGTRVIVKNLADCYNVLGIIHDLYKPVPGRFKDYVSSPKPNGYQSLHTVVIGKEGIPFEVQIRTEDMDKTAEYGIAAHWKYKGGLKGQQKEEAFAWVRQLLESQQDVEPEEFVQSIKVDLFADEVYVFTPGGDVINLPQGSTPIDFAYAIHSEVGNNMVGARVNGKIVNFDYVLKSGEIVDIVTSKTSTGPKRRWLQIVKTSGAKSKIRQWYKRERREENIEEGRNELERELRVNLLFDDFSDSELKTIILDRLKMPNENELYANIGYGGITVSRVVAKVKEEAAKLAKSKEVIDPEKVVKKPKRQPSSNGVVVEGIDNCLVKFAKCCSPVPGDQIIGFVTRGYGVSIHRQDCPNAIRGRADKETAERWIKTYWDNTGNQTFYVPLMIDIKTRVGAIADLISIFTNMRINIGELSGKDFEGGHSKYNISAAVNSVEQLELLMSRLRRVSGVSVVERINE
ncbi:MAG: bifunctional (p)ppGpp synthetase/guanosine-3',5'-bis(diphosphate) 3'-pyrophosphohydrolase [Clostridiaceae bacterium]|nr:bifunctional (p)ppGpp synthetase/guanosine-3',5'-bis(diphosphate) 3'-pyrophosphohydrolase [Clostridiaceae bacterium]